jgi:hypothetical protein
VQNSKRERAKKQSREEIKAVLKFGQKDRGKCQAILANAVLLVDAGTAA